MAVRHDGRDLPPRQYDLSSKRGQIEADDRINRISSRQLRESDSNGMNTSKSQLKCVHVLSMWRTGSTFLASRFAAAPQYKLFYEPFHEYIGSERALKKAAESYAAKRQSLNHPELDGSYFSCFESRDPLSDKPLKQLYSPASAIHDVYDQTSNAKTLEFLEACNRVAASMQQVAVFGFCRSGLQSAAFANSQDTAYLHLHRNQRSQFASYRWPENDYFMPSTLLQLLSSKQLRYVSLKWINDCTTSPRWRCFQLLDALVKAVPKSDWRIKIRLARRMTRLLNGHCVYGLFYLSWLICQTHNTQHSELSFSLDQLHQNVDGVRDQLESRFQIDLSGVQQTPDREIAGIKYDEVEDQIQRVFDLDLGFDLGLGI